MPLQSLQLHRGAFSVSESNFALVGMTGLMAGVLHAPLTAIFLIAGLPAVTTCLSLL